jgi:hypothetical protein
MFKQLFIRGIVTAIGASLACIVWDKIYFFAMQADFSQIINVGSILGANMFAGVMMAIGYFLLTKYVKKHGVLIFNILLSVLSIASFYGPLSTTLPLDIMFPELFLGLTAPMHLFPALAWFTLEPLFVKK